MTLSGALAPTSIALRFIEVHKLPHHSKVVVQGWTIIVIITIIILILLIIIILSLLLLLLLLYFYVIVHFLPAVPKSSHDLGALACSAYVMESVLLKIWALPKRTIFCTISTLTLPGIWLMYFPTPFVMRPNAPTATGIVLVFIFHIFVTSISRALYFDNYSICLIETFFSDGIVMSIMKHLLAFLPFTMISGLSALNLPICVDWRVP